MLNLKQTTDSDSDLPQENSAVKSGSPAAIGFKIASHSDCDSDDDGHDSFQNSAEERDQMIVVADVDFNQQ